MIAPTQLYSQVAAMDVESAAERSLRALITGQPRVMMPLGVIAELMHLAAPDLSNASSIKPSKTSFHRWTTQLLSSAKRSSTGWPMGQNNLESRCGAPVGSIKPRIALNRRAAAVRLPQLSSIEVLYGTDLLAKVVLPLALFTIMFGMGLSLVITTFVAFSNPEGRGRGSCLSTPHAPTHRIRPCDHVAHGIARNSSRHYDSCPMPGWDDIQPHDVLSQR